jgi:hypothetical protein
MAKGWIVLLLAVALALAVVPLAAAGNHAGGGKGKLKFELVGTVSAVDGAASLTVKVKAGSKPVKSFRGRDLRLVVGPGARARIVTAEGCTTALLADVPVGARVKVRGRVNRADPANLVYVTLDVKARVAAEPTPEPSLSPGE